MKIDKLVKKISKQVQAPESEIKQMLIILSKYSIPEDVAVKSIVNHLREYYPSRVSRLRRLFYKLFS